MSETESFFWSFFYVSEIWIKFRTFSKKRWAFLLKYSWNHNLPKEMVTNMSKTPYFRTRFGKQRVTGFELLLKSSRHHYYSMFPWIWEKLCWKKSVLVRSEILGLFVNTLTVEYMYSRRNMQNFTQLPLAQLSQKRKAFSGFFIAFLKCPSSLEHFEKKMSDLA